MGSCYMLPMWNAAECDSRDSLHQLYDLLCWHVIRGMHCGKDPPISSLVLCRLAGTRKTNHEDHAPLLPIISLIYSHLCLQFLAALSFYHLASSLIVIVFFYPCCCVFIFIFSWCLLLSTLSWVFFLCLIIARPCLPKSFIPCDKKLFCKSLQSSLPNLFILSTNHPFNSTCFGCVPPP